jgi:hypothetical protein
VALLLHSEWGGELENLALATSWCVSSIHSLDIFSFICDWEVVCGGKLGGWLGMFCSVFDVDIILAESEGSKWPRTATT